MSALIIIFSLLIGYVFFMMSFYLLAKALFPKVEHVQEEDNLLETIEIRKQESARLERANSQSFRFNKQPQVA